MWVSVVFMNYMQSPLSETFHSSNAQIHAPTSTVDVLDPLASPLDGPRANGAFLLRSLFEAPSSLRIRDEAPMTVVTVVRAGAWAVSDDDAPFNLRAGDVAVFRGPDHYTVADAPQIAPQIVIHSGQRCAAPGDTPGFTNIQSFR
jgi:Cupin